MLADEVCKALEVGKMPCSQNKPGPKEAEEKIRWMERDEMSTHKVVEAQNKKLVQSVLHDGVPLAEGGLHACMYKFDDAMETFAGAWIDAYRDLEHSKLPPRRAHDSMSVTHCRERSLLLPKAIRRRYELADAHRAYAASLRTMGTGLHDFLRAVQDASDDVEDVHIVFPPDEEDNPNNGRIIFPADEETETEEPAL
ncbi:hypothetical protein EJB05_43142, partial [Eragrostis curvula]